MVNHNIKNIAELINNPEKINDQDLSYFFDLTLKYPASNFCFLILTKILHRQNRIGFEKSLNSTSLRFGDRKILYDIIHNQKKVQKENTPSKKIIEFDNDINELEKNIYEDLWVSYFHILDNQRYLIYKYEIFLMLIRLKCQSYLWV